MSSSNSTSYSINVTTQAAVVASTSCPANFFFTYLVSTSWHVFTAVYCAGIVLNWFCVIVFSRILLEQKHHGHMFKYLLAKAICDSVDFTIMIFLIPFTSPDKNVSFSYIMMIWFFWFHNLVRVVGVQCSGIFEVLATFDCFLMITKKLQFCQTTLYFILSVIVAVVIGVLLNIYYLLAIQITPVQSVEFFGNNATYYYISQLPFMTTVTFRALDLLQGLFRDGVIFVLLVICNALILGAFAEFTQRRRRMHGQGSTTQNSLVTSAERAQRAKVLMITTATLNYLAGHTMPIIKLTNWLVGSPSQFWSCFAILSDFLLISSYVTPIIFYYLSNKSFKRVTHTILTCAKYRTTLSQSERSITNSTTRKTATAAK